MTTSAQDALKENPNNAVAVYETISPPTTGPLTGWKP